MSALDGAGPGTVVLPTGEYSRFTVFQASLMRCLAATPGARLAWNQGVDIAFNCNDAIRRRVGDWVWIIGDDHTFAPDIIHRLDAHDVDVVVPLVLQRNPPHRMVLYEADGSPIAVGSHERGLVPVGMAGSAGMLIREHVLHAIGDPWFTIAGTERQSEDIGFCQAVNRAGFRIYCDTGTTMGHVTSVEVWPTFDEVKGWQVGYRSTTGARLL